MEAVAHANSIRRWRQSQWIVIAAWIWLFAILGYLDASTSEKRTVWGCALAFFSALLHGFWITLDLKCSRRKVGAWRFAAFVLGPLTVWFYLIVAYGRRALWMIPVSLAIYLIPIGMVTIALAFTMPE